MAGDRNFLDNRLIQRRILDRHRNRTINILTRIHRDLAILTNGDRNILPILISSRSSGLIGLILNLQTRILIRILRLNRLRITRHSQRARFRGGSGYLGGSLFGQALAVDISGCLDFRAFSLLRNACCEGTGVLSIFLRDDNGAIRKLNPDICARLCLNSHSLAGGGQRLNRRGLRLLNRLVGSDNRLLRDCNLAGRGLSHSLVLAFVLNTGDTSDLCDTFFGVLPVEINGSYGLIEVDSDFTGLGVGSNCRLRNERNLYLRILVYNRNIFSVIVLVDFLRNIDDEFGIRGLDLGCLRIRSAYLVAAGVIRISIILQNFLTIRNTVTIGIELGGVGAELGLVGIEKAVAIGICQAEVGVAVGIRENLYGRATVSLIEEVGVNPASKIDVSAGCFLDTFQCPVLELVLDRHLTGLAEYTICDIIPVVTDFVETTICCTSDICIVLAPGELLILGGGHNISLRINSKFKLFTILITEVSFLVGAVENHRIDEWNKRRVDLLFKLPGPVVTGLQEVHPHRQHNGAVDLVLALVVADVLGNRAGKIGITANQPTLRTVINRLRH